MAFQIETLEGLMKVAAEVESNLISAGYDREPAIRQGLALAEEAGEFVGALRRYKGLARRSGTFQDMAAELADVVITAFVAAVTLDINLPAEINQKMEIIFTRPWREPQAVSVIIQPAIEIHESRNTA